MTEQKKKEKKEMITVQSETSNSEFKFEISFPALAAKLGAFYVCRN